MQYRKPVLGTVTAALAMAALHAAAAAPRYKVEGFADWENFGLTSANAINNFYDGNRSWLMPFEGGFVGINDHDVMITGQGLIYDHGHVSNLPPVQGRDMYYMSRAINNAGQVTGTVVFQDESRAVPFLYSNGTIEILGTLAISMAMRWTSTTRAGWSANPSRREKTLMHSCSATARCTTLRTC